jgi:hypothetical protein
MAGWSHSKRVAVEKAYYAYLDRCYINSKDTNEIVCLGKSLYQGQRDVITQIFDALEDDVHDIYILKSRQLGISTIIRSLITFLTGIFKGIKSALVFDTSDHKSEAREDLKDMIEELPESLKFPGIKRDNRTSLTLSNKSKVLFYSAGIRESKSSGTLGRSVGLSLAHCSEMCSWQNVEGLESFKQSLSDSNPDRLYIWESTARGYNMWNEMWREARADPAHCRCIFLGWWSKDSQRIERDNLKDWPLYGDVYPPSKEELEKIRQVKELYGHDITLEQLAWVRRKYDPKAREEGDVDPKFEANTTRIQEQPWTEEDAFQQTGAVFFTSEKLKDQSDQHVSRKFECWMFIPGKEFPDMAAIKAENSKSIELRVWEPPQTESVYVVGTDPAFGEDETNDRSSIQVLKCYADGMDQVAEYAWPLTTTKHLAWVLAAIMAWYGNEPLSEVYHILELNGPGNPVLNELKGLKFQIDHGYAPLAEQGLKNIFRNVRSYMYARPDSLTGGGSAWHWKTTTQLKVMILEQLRGYVSNGMLRVRSAPLIEEMRTIGRAGDTIKAEGSQKDDRVLAMALASYMWEQRVRRSLIVQKRTREADAAKRNKSVVDQVGLFNASMMEAMFKQKQSQRLQMQRLAMTQAWRGRRY